MHPRNIRLPFSFVFNFSLCFFIVGLFCFIHSTFYLAFRFSEENVIWIGCLFFPSIFCVFFLQLSKLLSLSLLMFACLFIFLVVFCLHFLLILVPVLKHSFPPYNFLRPTQISSPLEFCLLHRYLRYRKLFILLPCVR